MSQSFAAPSSAGLDTTGSKTSGMVPLAGRILIAVLFLMSGAAKLAAPATTIAYIHSVGLPFAPLGLALAVLIEIGGSAALVVGYRTRLVALVMAGFAIATALAFHNNFADQNQLIHFFKNVSIAGGLLQVAAFGGGRLSLDARRR